MVARGGSWCKLGLVAILATGCGLQMEGNYQKMRPQLVSRNFQAADKHIDSKKESFYGKDNRLLYYMDKGLVLHLDRRYQESNQFLEKASSTAEELWTESVGKNAAAWLTTDNSLPYQGEDFEKVFIHFFGALNYIGLGSYSGARVEARQITNKLELYNTKYEEEKASSAYRDDAFARWLSGKLAQTEGDQSGLNDAWIDYQKSIKVYSDDYAKRYSTPIPQFVVADALRAAEGLGAEFKEDFAKVRRRFPDVTYVPEEKAKGLGEVVFIHMNGEAPAKVDKFWTIQQEADVLRIAYPEFVPKNPRIRGVRLKVRGSDIAATGELAEDVTAIAVQNLNDHMGRIKAKAIARAVAKFVAGKALQSSKNKGGGGAAMYAAGVLWNAGNALAEEADKRSWITLPGQIYVGRLFAPPGKAVIDVQFVDAVGAVVDTAQFDVELKAGKTLFLSRRTFI